MNLHIIAIIALVAFLSGFGGGWKVNGWYASSKREIADQAASEALQKAAVEIAKIEVRHVTIRQQLETVVREKLVYTECKHTDDGMRLINEALLPPGSSGVPKSGANK